MLVLAEGGRTQAVETVTSYLASGHPVMATDLTAVGEIRACKQRFYGSKHTDEGIGVMLYLLGESLVGRRAEEIIVCARAHAAANGGAPLILHARGGLAVAAAHAFAAEPTLFAKLELADAPLAWAEVIRRADRFNFALCVQNALRFYDWTDLCTPASALRAE